MSARIRPFVAFLLLLFALPANAQGGLRIPFPGKKGGNNGQALVAAAQTEVEKQIIHMVGDQIGVNAPLKLDQTTAYPKVPDLTDFHAQPWHPQSQNDLRKPLLPGDYAISVGAFCTDYSIHVPGRGTPYKLAPVQGRQSAMLTRLLVRGTQQGVDHETLQYMNMRLQASIPLREWPDEYKAIIHRIDPEDETALEGDFLAQSKKIYDDHNRIPFFKLPSFDKILTGMGEEGQYVLKLERARKILTDKAHKEEMNPALLYEPQGDGLPLNLPPLRNAPPSPWSNIKPGIYARFTPQEGWHGDNLLEFRITTEAIIPPDPKASIHAANAACIASTLSVDSLPKNTPLLFPSVATLLGMSSVYPRAMLVPAIAGGGSAVAGEVIGGGFIIVTLPEVVVGTVVVGGIVAGDLLISYAIDHPGQALILISRALGNGDDKSNKEAIKKVDDAIEELREGSTPGKGSGTVDESIKPGGQSQADMDFDRMIEQSGTDPRDVKQIDTDGGPGRTATLPDGTTANEYPASNTTGGPTIQIRRPGAPKQIKQRYVL